MADGGVGIYSREHGLVIGSRGGPLILGEVSLRLALRLVWSALRRAF